jgi:hypothetical protein
MLDDDKLKNVRQPLVTATGILLGFTLNIAANWIPKAFTTNRITEALMALSLCVHIPLSIVVLYRILNINYPKVRAERYYRKTLILFITGISLYFFLIVLIMYESAIINNR